MGCREVAIANGVRYWGGNGHSSGADPKGCIYRTPDKDIYFNTHSTGSTSRGDRRTVCVAIPQRACTEELVLHGQQRWTSRFSRCTSRTVPREVVSCTERAWRGSGTASTTQTAGRQTATDARSLLLVLHQIPLPTIRTTPHWNLLLTQP